MCPLVVSPSTQTSNSWYISISYIYHVCAVGTVRPSMYQRSIFWPVRLICDWPPNCGEPRLYTPRHKTFKPSFLHSESISYQVSFTVIVVCCLLALFPLWTCIGRVQLLFLPPQDHAPPSCRLPILVPILSLRTAVNTSYACTFLLRHTPCISPC